MRVFKNKYFSKWATHEGLSDDDLWNAAEDAFAGRVEADLGGYIFKKRVARAGAGKSGGYRTIMGFRKNRSERIVFLYGFAKNRRANISTREQAALSVAADGFIGTSDSQVEALKSNGRIFEVERGK